MHELTSARLREVLRYDPSTGKFYWVRGKGTASAGQVAGRIGSAGYRDIGVDGHLYRASRLAWLYVTGQWPTIEIDHKNLDCSDDSWGNLREATRSQNCSNRRGWASSGFKGVTRQKSGKWIARIRVDNRLIYLGQFATAEEASAVYARAAREKHGEFAVAA